MKKFLNISLFLLCCFASTVYATERKPADAKIACDDEREPVDEHEKKDNANVSDEKRPEGESRSKA